MDLLREVPANQVVLTQGYMRVPDLGRRSVDGDSYVGSVSSGGGQAGFYRSDGDAYDWIGVGLVAGYNEG